MSGMSELRGAGAAGQPVRARETQPESSRLHRRALAVICAGVMLVVLDSSVLNIALPAIREELDLTGSSLAWIVNAYTLAFGGCLILGGRLGDVYGARTMFLISTTLFTVASIACGIATNPGQLILARALQGLAGAVVMAVALALILRLFSEGVARARALALYGFVATGVGSAGVLLGGAIVSTIGWRWIFLINAPVGVIVLGLSAWLLPRAVEPGLAAQQSLDAGGAATGTAALVLAICAITRAREIHWVSPGGITLLGAIAGLSLAFVWIERRAQHPIIPFDILRVRNFVTACSVLLLWAAAAPAWLFFPALYMQRVLHFSPMQIALTFALPNAVVALFALGVSARVVTRFGIRGPLCLGLALGVAGLALLAGATPPDSALPGIVPGMTLMGLAAALAFNPILLAGVGDVGHEFSGLASGILNTTSLMGGALGMALLSTLSDARIDQLENTGIEEINALVGGYHLAFTAGAFLAGLAMLMAIRLPTRHS